MTYSKIENCHISDLVNYLSGIGFTKEQYPSKKTCIEELRKRGIYQIDVKPKRIINPNSQTPRKLSKNVVINNLSETSRSLISPVFEADRCTVSESVVSPIPSHSHSNPHPIYDASYVHLGVSQNMYVEKALYLRGENINTTVDNINNTYTQLEMMLTDINDKIQELDDKTSFIANMNLPSFNIAKNISYDDIYTRIYSDNRNIFSDISNVSFSGKLLDTTSYIHVSFKAVVKQNIQQDLLTVVIRLPSNSMPDNTMIFDYYPVVYNIVNIKSDGTLDFFYSGQKSRVAYVDTQEKSIILRVDNQSNTLDNISISIQTSYFTKPVIATSGRMIADVIGPIRHSTLYSKQDVYEFENKTTYVWTVFDEQVDLFIHYRYVSNIDDNINENTMKNIGLELPFKASQLPYIDKIGHSIIRYKPIQSLDEWVSYNHNFIIRKEDPNTLFMDIGTRVPYDIDVTIQVSYFRDISDQITNLVFWDNMGVGYDTGERVYYKASDVFKVTFITTEPINSYYLNNKLSLTNLGDFENTNIGVSFQGLQTLWDVGISTDLNTDVAFSIDSVRCEINLFNQKYVSDNELIIINSYMNIQTSYRQIFNSSIEFRFSTNNGTPLTLYDLPHILYIEIKNRRYPGFFPTFTHEYSFSNIQNYLYVYDNIIHNTIYDVLIYTVDALQRYHVVTDVETITEATFKPHIYTYELVETLEGVQIQSKIFLNLESNVEFIINTSDPYDIFYYVAENGNVSSTDISLLLQLQNNLVVSNKTNPVTEITINRVDLPIVNSYFVSIIATPFNVHTIDRITYITLPFTPQSIINCTIQNTTYNEGDDIHYIRHLRDLSYIVTKSKPFMITATLGPHVSFTSGNMISFVDDPLVADIMHLEIELLMLPNYVSDANVVVSSYIHTSETCNLSFQNVDYEYYRVTIDFNDTDSYMKYTASIEFDEHPIANQIINDQITHFVNPTTFEVYISQDQIPGGMSNISGNVLLEDRIGDIYRKSFLLNTTPSPQIILEYQQYGRFVHIHANIDNTHPSFRSWDGNVRWYIDDMIQPTRNSIHELYILEIIDFNTTFERTFKANVDFNSINIYGSLQQSIYGIRYSEFTFNNTFYKPGDDVQLQFTILNTNQNAYSNVYVELYDESTDHLISNQYSSSFQGEYVNVSVTIPLNDNITYLGEFYANVTFQSENNYIWYTTKNIVTLIDLTPIESIESYIELSSSFNHFLYVSNITDDTFIEHSVYVFIFYNEQWNSFGNIVVSKHSSFPIYIGELPSLYNYNTSIIKYEVYDILHITPKYFYIPTHFMYQAYNTYINHYIDTTSNELFGNVSFDIISANVNDDNIHIDYSWISSIDQSITTGNVNISTATERVYIQSQLDYNTLYTFRIQIGAYESNIGDLLPVFLDTNRSFSIPMGATFLEHKPTPITTEIESVPKKPTPITTEIESVPKKPSNGPRIVKMKKR